MKRHFGLNHPAGVGETTSGVPLAQAGALGPYATHANLQRPLPSGWMGDRPVGPSLKPLDFRYALLDVVVGGLTGILLAFGFFLLLFVQT